VGVRSFTERDGDPTIDLPYFYGSALEAVMRRRSLTFILAVAAMTCGGMLATRADDWKATGEYDWHDAGGRNYEMEKGHTYWVGEVVGKFFNDKGKGSLFDQAEVRCSGFNDTDANNKRIKEGGYCVWTDADGDHAYSIWEANDTLGFEVKGHSTTRVGLGNTRGSPARTHGARSAEVSAAGSGMRRSRARCRCSGSWSISARAATIWANT
jgi:hypothetical protein